MRVSAPARELTESTGLSGSSYSGQADLSARRRISRRASVRIIKTVQTLVLAVLSKHAAASGRIMHNLVRGIYQSAFALLILALAWTAQAQGTPPKLPPGSTPSERPTLLGLGTGHLANPGKDLVNTPVENVLTEKRQAQIASVVDELAAFRPTFIALEWPIARQAKLDSAYADYRAGRLAPSANEHQQLGMRLGKKLNLARIHAVDWNEAPPGDEKVYDYVEWSKTHGQGATLQALIDRTTATSVRLRADESIGDWLIRMNDPQAILRDHRAYFDIAAIGDSESQPGAAWVGTWYARNLRIFTNLTRLTARPEDRIIVIYGAGHAYLLRQFAIESGAFRLIDVDQVLSSVP
jgi:Family of unknown function (DUF5694)